MNNKNKRMRKKKIWKKSEFYFILILAIMIIALTVQLLMLQILPVKYTIAIIAILSLLFILLAILMFNRRINRFNRILGKIIIVFLTICLCAGNYYVYKGGETLRNISGANIKTDAISVIVKKDSKAAETEDVTLIKDGIFGILSKTDRNNTSLAIEDISTKVDKTIDTTEFDIANDMAEDLYNDEIDAVILNEAYRGMLEDKYPDFQTDTKVIYQYEIETELNDISKNVNVTKQPFTVYISGIDTYGSVNAVSRSDVNMLATVNPLSHQIALISIPRDYYIPQTCQGNQEDKLTHTGIFGVDCTISSVENYFDVSINYYARVNFSSLINIVDSLGGITVDNPYAFTSNEGYTYPVGEVYLSGIEALSYSRDRYHQPEGDRDRGKNQMRVITGIINKAISPTIITNYTSVMDAVSGSLETNMASNEITKFIQKQLDTMSGWNIVQYSVNGTGSGADGAWSPANGFNSYVMYPDLETVEEAKSLIDRVNNGETIN